MICNHWKEKKTKRLSSRDFYNNYDNRSKPVIISGITSNWDSSCKWSLDYFKNLAPDLNLVVKDFKKVGKINLKYVKLKKYIEDLRHYEKLRHNNGYVELPFYCHDLTLFSLIDSLIKDVRPLRLDYLSKWYWHK